VFVLAHEDGVDLASDWVVLGVGAIGALVLGALLRSVLRANAYKQDVVVLLGAALAVAWTLGAHETWVPQAVASCAVVLVATAISIAFAHLFFIGAPTMLADWRTHRDVEQFTAYDLEEAKAADKPPSEAQQVLDWRKKEPTRDRPHWRVRLRANIVFPGANRPSGPLQQKVAEVFDSDDPPFAKHFLVITSTEHQLTIRMRPVTGTDADLPCYPIPIEL
jgi:hypothetical protein